MLTAVKYRELLGAALPKVVDADTIDPDPQTLFTPSAHRNALDPDMTIVCGGRGVGKTVWFKALQAESLRAIAASAYQLDRLNRVETLPGFSANLSKQYPSPRRLQSLTERFQPSDIWTAVALFGFEIPGVQEIEDWPERVQWVVDNPGSPRSFLSALWRATERTAEAFSGHPYALHWDAIRQGVQHASRIRVLEVKEDTPWVANAIEPLTGAQVPIEREEVIRRWEEAGLVEELTTQRERTNQLTEDDVDDQAMFATGPLSTGYDDLIDELIGLGVMTIRTNKKLDLPDVYRIAFGIGRKGGVPRPKQQ